MLVVSSWDPRVPTSLSCQEAISRGKTAVHSQANWDSGQLFIPDAKSQMHTHSSLSLPKPEVSSFIEFVNSLRDLLKSISPGSTSRELDSVQAGQEISMLNNNTPTPSHLFPSTTDLRLILEVITGTVAALMDW